MSIEQLVKTTEMISKLSRTIPKFRKWVSKLQKIASKLIKTTTKPGMDVITNEIEDKTPKMTGAVCFIPNE